MKKAKKLKPGRVYMIASGDRAMGQEGFCRPLDEHHDSILWKTATGSQGGINLINQATKEKLRLWKCGWCGILGERLPDGVRNLPDSRSMISEEFLFTSDPYSETGWLVSKICGCPYYLTEGFIATTFSSQAGEFILYEVMHMDDADTND